MSPHRLRRSLPKALEAAEQLRGEGIEAEVIDLRVLRPLDDATIMASVRQDAPGGGRRRGLAHRQPRRGDQRPHRRTGFYELDAPMARVCSEEVPIPYAKHLEEAALPQPDKIVAAVRALFGTGDERA
jgi:pyruvate dehydrogenase E1 component beta subunit